MILTCNTGYMSMYGTVCTNSHYVQCSWCWICDHVVSNFNFFNVLLPWTACFLACSERSCFLVAVMTEWVCVNMPQFCFLLSPAHATLEPCDENHDYFDLWFFFSFNSAVYAQQDRRGHYRRDPVYTVSLIRSSVCEIKMPTHDTSKFCVALFQRARLTCLCKERMNTDTHSRWWVVSPVRDNKSSRFLKPWWKAIYCCSQEAANAFGLPSWTLQHVQLSVSQR